MQNPYPNSYFQTLLARPLASTFSPNHAGCPPGPSGIRTPTQQQSTTLHYRFSTLPPTGPTVDCPSVPANRPLTVAPRESTGTAERPIGTYSLPIGETRDLIELETALSSMQQYETLLGHLQAMTLRHNGALVEMFRNLFVDSIIARVRMSKHASGQPDSVNLTDFPRVMSAVKSAWFPDKDQASFRLHLSALVKNAQEQCSAAATRAVEQPEVPAPENGGGGDIQRLRDQWYQYAIYYRDRYQVVKRENQKIKASYEATKRRVSRCITKMQGMELQMNLLEHQIRENGD